MKQVAISLLAIVLLGGLVAAQQNPAPMAPAQPAPAAQPAPTVPPAPAYKAPPQARSQAEYQAYQDASQLKDAAAIEAAANSFAAKFKDSELRFLLYCRAMSEYQTLGQPERAIAMGRKALSISPDDPATMAQVGSLLAEQTKDTDLDRNERLNEALLDSQRALQKVDTDLVLPANTPPERVEEIKTLIRSTAYGTIGSVDLVKGNYADAEKNLKQALDQTPKSPDVIFELRYAIALDQQKKYPEALAAANKAVELSPAGSPEATWAKQERDRILNLTGK
jgi:tetratricopeptide (TPR) repeat protein